MKKILLSILFTLIFLNNTVAQNFQEILNTPFNGVYRGAVAFDDIDGDGDLDILYSGLVTPFQELTELYINDGLGNFTLVTSTPFSNTAKSSIAFCDVDNDNDNDVLITGSGATPIALYKNDGLGNFTLFPNPALIFGATGSIDFADIDNDNDKDLLITGSGTTILYENNGNGLFSVLSNMPFDSLHNSDAAFADVDNDNDLDVIISGNRPQCGTNCPYTKLFINDGTGNFTLSGASFTNLKYSTVEFADIDNDNDQDLLLSGQNSSGGRSTRLYSNDGLGNFTILSGTGYLFPGVAFGSTPFADVDNDNDLDLVITGGDASGVARLYINDGSGLFTYDAGTFLTGVAFSSIAFGDIDGDSDNDLIITGRNGSTHITKLYRNIHCNQSTTVDIRAVCDSLTWIDGITYSSNNNTATFNIAGGNSNSCDSLVTLNLTVSNLDANYTFTDNGSGNYSFTNTSTGNFNQSHWAFGDGTTSTTVNPNHTFITNGTYVVVLTINDSTTAGTCVDYFVDTLVVTGLPSTTNCIAGYAIYPDTINGGLIVVNSSTGNSLTYLWGFGDGSTSTLQNPSHTYATAGPFNLCLTVDDGSGCNNMYCDSIGENGVLFKGAAGFTINVISATTTRIDKLSTSSDVTIYPNPTANQLTIVSNQFTFNKITIVDIAGRTVKRVQKETNTVNVANLPAGIYFINLISDDRTIIKKFVKK